jgi:two-component system phosphate regulon sensor histidine kinase PhoR
MARQHAVFDSMTEGLLLLDSEGKVQLANRSFIQFFGLGEQVQGRTVLEATRSHELAELAAGVAQNSRLTNRLLRLPGPEERHVEINAAPIIGKEGRQEGLVVVLHDVSRLRRSEKARDEFVANVRHELRTPLSLIKGYAETLLDMSQEDPKVVRKFLKTIDRNATRLAFLIEDLLAISSLESGRLRMEPTPTPLSELVRRAIQDCRPAADLRGVQLRTEIQDLEVTVDVERLHQVLSNLLDNAIKYGREKGHVVVTARPVADQMVEVCVKDDGLGIPSDSLNRIFERFYRVDKARSRDQGGTGLGLSIVKHIIQSHQGQVWAESELGKGASVFFTVPQAPTSQERRG